MLRGHDGEDERAVNGQNATRLSRVREIPQIQRYGDAREAGCGVHFPLSGFFSVLSTRRGAVVFLSPLIPPHHSTTLVAFSARIAFASSVLADSSRSKSKAVHFGAYGPWQIYMLYIYLTSRRCSRFRKKHNYLGFMHKGFWRPWPGRKYIV